MVIYTLKHKWKSAVLRNCGSLECQILEDIENSFDNHDDTSRVRNLANLA